MSHGLNWTKINKAWIKLKSNNEKYITTNASWKKILDVSYKNGHCSEIVMEQNIFLW